MKQNKTIVGLVIATLVLSCVAIAVSAEGGGVEPAAIMPGAITSEHLANPAVATIDIENNAVTGDKLADSITIADALTVTGATTLNGAVTLGDATADIVTVTGTIAGASPLIFEGATANDFETTFVITDPTADRTITFPDASGEASFLGQTIGTTEIENDAVTSAKLAAQPKIVNVTIPDADNIGATYVEVVNSTISTTRTTEFIIHYSGNCMATADPVFVKCSLALQTDPDTKWATVPAVIRFADNTHVKVGNTLQFLNASVAGGNYYVTVEAKGDASSDLHNQTLSVIPIPSSA